MTISLDFVTIAGAIAALDIPGISIKDITGIPDSNLLTTPVMYPIFERFITDFNGFNPETFGISGNEQMTVTYTLNYRYLHCTIGTISNVAAVYGGFIENIEKIAEKIMNNDTLSGVTDIRLGLIPAMGTIPDSVGNMYLGCDLQMFIKEYVGGA